MSRLLRVSRYLHLGTSSTLLVSACVQAATFALLARGLGASGFGILMILQPATQVGLVAMSLGTGEAFIRRVSRDRSEHGKAFGHALLVTLLAWLVIGTALSLLADKLGASAIGAIPLAVFIFGELFGNRLAALAEQVAIAHGRVDIANHASFTPACLRMGVVILGVLVFHPVHVADWLVLLGVTRVASGLLMAGQSAVRFGLPVANFNPESFRFGLLCFVVGLSNAVQFNADRLILGALSAPSVVAIYAAAVRAVQFANLPGLGVLRNLYPGFFRAGTEGIAATRAFAYKNLPRMLMIGMACALLLLGCAGFIPLVMGPDYAGAVVILRWLAFIPLLQNAHGLFADVLTGSDNQVFRTTIGVTSTLVYLALIGSLTALFGIAGLILGTYLFEISVIAASIAAIEFIHRRERRYAPAATNGSISLLSA